MADGKIYITISDTRGGSGAGVGEEAETQDKKNKSGMQQFMKVFGFVEGQAKQFLNYSVANIGNFTGNYQSQREVQAALNAVNFTINLGTSIFVGAKTGGVPGAIIAGVLSIASKAIEFGYREYSESFENRKVNRNIDMMRNRLGLQGLTDGSRTGGY